MINQDDLKEFRQEASELLVEAERGLLSLEDGGSFKTEYNAIFRAFHNLKGAAGMMELTELQTHTHHLENKLTSLKEKTDLTKDEIDHFLNGIDGARKLMGANDEIPSVSETGEQGVNSVAASQSSNPNQVDAVSANEGPTVFPTIAVTIAPLEKVELSKILIFAKDNELNSFADLFRQKGYEVQLCTDPFSGIASSDEFKPSMVLASSELSQLSGGEICDILINKNLTLVILGNDVKPADREKYEASGILCFEASKISPELLLNYVKSNIENKNLKILLEESIRLLKFQLSDIVDYLKSTGKTHIEKMLMEDFKKILDQKAQLFRKK